MNPQVVFLMSVLGIIAKLLIFYVIARIVVAIVSIVKVSGALQRNEEFNPFWGFWTGLFGGIIGMAIVLSKGKNLIKSGKLSKNVIRAFLKAKYLLFLGVVVNAIILFCRELIGFIVSMSLIDYSADPGSVIISGFVLIFYIIWIICWTKTYIKHKKKYENDVEAASRGDISKTSECEEEDVVEDESSNEVAEPADTEQYKNGYYDDGL